MVSQDSLLVTLVKLSPDVCPDARTSRETRARASACVFGSTVLEGVSIMIVRHLHKVHELLSVLAQPTEEMRTLRLLLTEQEHFPSRRTWERRLKTLPQTLPAQIGCLGRHLVFLFSRG